jgi:Fe-S cluster assembly scaffold protein SufB
MFFLKVSKYGGDEGARTPDLSHEAAVGKIKEEELWYLMSRNLSEDEATSLIIKGYLDPGIFGLPAELEEEIKKIAGMTTEDAI